MPLQLLRQSAPDCRERHSGMAPHHAFFALPLLLLGTTVSIRGGNTTCGWAVDSCERSDKDSECKVRLRRWCPCVRSSWQCECKTKKCDSDESVMVNVSVAREMTRTKLMYATRLENFCNLWTCFTFRQKCFDFDYYVSMFEGFFPERCCHQEYMKSTSLAFCKKVTKYQWCFLILCGYHPKPKSNLIIRSQTWPPENDLKRSKELQTELDDNSNIVYGLPTSLYLFLVIGLPVICGTPILVIVCIALFCKKDVPNSSTTTTATAADKQERRPLTTMQPQPGEPVPLNRLPDHLKEKLPDPPREDMNIPE